MSQSELEPMEFFVEEWVVTDLLRVTGRRFGGERKVPANPCSVANTATDWFAVRSRLRLAPR